MKIDETLIKKMAELSRIKLNEDEIAQLKKEFKEIFEYFSRIKEIEESKGQFFYLTKEKNKLRIDKSKTDNKADRIVDNFAQKDKRLLIAPRTLD